MAGKTRFMWRAAGADGVRRHRPCRSASVSICDRGPGLLSVSGLPEGELALAQAVVYLAVSPKSNGVYAAYKSARRSAREHGSLAPPKTILNAPTRLMKEQGYGADYAYDHNAPDGMSGQSYFPDAMTRETYYDPPDRGFERDIRKRLEWFARKRAEWVAAGHGEGDA
jgi:putative ATPase